MLKTIDIDKVEKWIDNYPFYALWKDSHSYYQYCNVNYANLSGYRLVTDLIGKNDYDLACHEFADLYIHCDSYVMKNKTWSGIEMIKTATDQLLPIYTKKTPVVEKNIVQGILVQFQILNHCTDAIFKHIKDMPLKIKNTLCKPSLQQNVFRLTPRELQCLYYLVKGMSCKQIAAALCISKRTVECHVNHLKEKFGVSSKNDLIRASFEENIFSLLPPVLLNL